MSTITDDFHHRLSRLEQKVAKPNAAPTVPKYDLIVNPFTGSYSPSTTIQAYGNGGLAYIASIFATIDIDGVTQVSYNDLFFNNLFAMPAQKGTAGPANATRANDANWHYIVFQADRVGTDTWTASLSFDGINASTGTSVAYWLAFPRIEHIDFYNNGWYVDNLSVVSDVGNFSHDFEDSTFGPFVQGDWTIATNIIGHDKVAFGGGATAVMQVTLGSFALSTGAQHVTMTFDALFPPFLP